MSVSAEHNRRVHVAGRVFAEMEQMGRATGRMMLETNHPEAQEIADAIFRKMDALRDYRRLALTPTEYQSKEDETAG